MMLGADMLGGRNLKHEITVVAPPERVWQAWTTVEGVTAFFCAGARIELRVGGPYEIYFSLDVAAGSRGSESCEVLEFDAPQRLVFTWNFPPSIPAIRFEHTRVEMTFTPTADGHTEIMLVQSGWQDGPDWEEGYRYFDLAWPKVLHWCQQYFAGEVPDSKRG